MVNPISRRLSSMMPSRANAKRLLYWSCVWTVLGYGLIHFTTREATTYFTGHLQRGLLQKVAPQDLNTIQQTLVGETYRPAGWTPPSDPLIMVPQVDNSPDLDERQLLKALSNVSNLPLEYWTADSKNKAALTTIPNCARFPALYDLEFNNLYWQKMAMRNGSSFYVYAAYYDDRWRGGQTAHVRILGMVDRIKPAPTLCQLWFAPQKDADGNVLKSPLIGQVTYTYGWVRQWGNYKDGLLQPFLISCRIPYKEAAGRIPTAVSLVEKQCDKQTTNLRVYYDRPSSNTTVAKITAKNDAVSQRVVQPTSDPDPFKRGKFAVCVKGLDFLHEDLSVRMVEWLELLRIMGAEKVFLYELDVHPNISKVLRYYSEVEDLTHVTQITLPGAQPNLPGLRHLYLKAKLTAKRQNEVIPYNDCLYRNLYRYEYLALLDVDEIIMPLNHSNWREMMVDVVKQALAVRNYTRASYNFRNVYFLDDLQDGDELLHEAHEQGIPRYLHMLQHVYRSRNYTKPGSYVKCFHNTDRAVWLHNHFPLSCFGSCTTWSVDTTMAHMQHYRKDCVGPLKKSCSKDFRLYTTRDTTIWKYKDELIKRSTNVLTKLGFFR